LSRISYLMEEMSWTDVRDALRNVQVAIIPIGSHEQHGPYLSENCDTILAQRFAGLVGNRMFPQVIVTPAVVFGVSFHHMTFPGTISFMPETLTCVLRDIVRSLTHHGLRKYLFLNGHGGNNATLNTAAVSVGQELGVQIADVEFIQLAPQSVKKVASAAYGHSCELEVSEALYLAPEIVKKELLKIGRASCRERV
jgi:creatinine amidohydrolase